MTSVPTLLPARGALAAVVGFLLLAVAVAAAAAAMASLADACHLAVPLFPAIGAGLAGLVIGGRRRWPAVVLGSLAASLLHAGVFPLPLDILAALASGSIAWLGAGLIAVGEDGRPLHPRLLPLLAVCGAIVIACAAGTLLGAVLGGVAIDSVENVRGFAVYTCAQTIIAFSVLLWPAGATPVSERTAVLLGAIGLPGLSAALLLTLGIAPGAWLAVPLLLWAGAAFRRRLSVAAMLLVLIATLAAYAARAPLPLDLLPFMGLVVTAILLIDALGTASRASIPLAARHDAEMTAFVTDAPVAIAALGRDLRYRAVSRRYLRDLRLEDQPSLLGQRASDALPAYAEHLGDGLRRALAGEKVSRPVGKVRMADGTCEYLRSELQPWYDADGAIGGVMVFGEIATDAVRSRATIEEAEARYRGVFEQAGAGFARCGLDGRYLEVNDRFCEITGHARAALLAKTYRDITHPLDLARCADLLHALVTQPGERISTEKRYCTRDGLLVWVAMSATMVRDADGAPLYIVSAVQDITARKDAQAALAKSELRLRLAQSAAGAGFWEIDLERWTIIASADMLRLHGLSPDRTDGVPLEEWDAIFDAATRQQFEATGFASRDVAQHDLVYRVTRPDGSERWVHSMGRTYRTTDGGRRIIGLALDVTAAQTAQAEVRRAQATMLRVSHLSAMGSVAATLAHELNQPLAAIVNYIEVCARILKAQGDSGQSHLLDAVLQAQTQALRAGQLVQKIRQLAPNSAATRRREPIGAILDAACTTIAPDAAAADVPIHRRAIAGAEEILADRLQIEQVVIGLFHNAIEAMRASAHKRIDLSAERHGEWVILRIADTGPGIADTAMPHLFEPFGDPRARGSGLALPVCRTIIESHNGKIAAESLPAGGTAFIVTLPVAPPTGRRALPDPQAANLMENTPR